jgi:death-on-curing protein
MIFTSELVVSIHTRIIQTSGGSKGIRDFGLLDSSVQSIYQTFDGKELYSTTIEKGARLCFSLNSNHAFIDGNKRIAMHMLAVFLRFHDVSYKPVNAEVIRVGFSVASGEMSYELLLDWVKANTK